MSKKKPRSRSAEPHEPVEKQARASTGFREIDVTALLAALCCCLLAWQLRHALNPDGVSYLNLAEALRRGEWSSFIQGYWSPLYPALIAASSVVFGGNDLVTLAHAVNAVTVCLMIATIWWWGRKFSDPWFGRVGLAVALISSARPPRVEAITPDLLLAAGVMWLAYELLHHRGARWVAIGIAMGVIYLAKTSAAPWLLVVMIVRLVGARAALERRTVLKSASLAMLTTLLWIVPLSIKSGSPTTGSSGRLNFGWYLGSQSSDTPDRQTGSHRSYRSISVTSNQQYDIALFDSNQPWTYQPWGDPTAWATGVTSANSVYPTFGALAQYWFTNLRNVITIWMLQLLLLVLAPVLIVSWRRRSLPPGTDEISHRRDALIALGLGCVGIAQFIVVHAEPRLIAPFALLFGVAVATLLVPGQAERITSGRWMWHTATLAGLLSTAVSIGYRLQDGVATEKRLREGLPPLRQTMASVTPPGVSTRRLVVVGTAMPIVANAYLLDWQIVAQVLPESAGRIASLPVEEMGRTVNQMFVGKADAAWVVLPDGQFQLIRIDQ